MTLTNVARHFDKRPFRRRGYTNEVEKNGRLAGNDHRSSLSEIDFKQARSEA